MSDASVAMVCVAVIAGALALIFWTQDRRTPSSRALSLTFLSITALMLIGAFEGDSDPTEFWRGVTILLEGAGLLSGLEWIRRVARASAGRFKRALDVLLCAAQVLMLVFALMSLGYLFIAPEAATSDRAGFITARGYEFAIFAPILGTSALLTLISTALLLGSRMDPAEARRVRAMVFASPFFIGALIVSPRYVPLLIASGMAIFLLGAVGYLMIISRRAQFMGQFLSPELRALARDARQSLAAELRPISVVACDLRGFTTYAAEQPSGEVTALLEDYFEAVGQVVAARGGTIKDHAGDGVLILVGAPLVVDDRVTRALTIAREIRESVSQLMRQRATGIGIGVGVASGDATVGAVKGAGRLEYMAVGQVVNLAARLCDAAEDDEILVDDATFSALSDREGLVSRPNQSLKGMPSQTIHCLPSGRSGRDQDK